MQRKYDEQYQTYYRCISLHDCGRGGLCVAFVENAGGEFYRCRAGSRGVELEGHAALRINGGPMSDFMVTYGVFDFDSPNFIYRFVKGDAEYSMGIIPWRYVSEAYRREGRTLMEYPLALDSVATARLMEMIYDNYRPENRYYRYNYVLDNCVTRPLRIVELAIGDSIIVGEPASDAAADRTFRQVMRRYHKNISLVSVRHRHSPRLGHRP